jgi:membrane-associated phospholipid phosphatase
MKVRLPLPRKLLLGPVLALAVATAGAAEKDTVERLGDLGQFAPVVAGIGLAGAHGDLKGLGELALTSATAMVITHSLKPLVDRRRPDGGGRSFPSGHTAIAGAGAGFIHLRYGWPYALPAYAAAAFVGYSRVHAQRHHTSDVLAGGALGIASSLPWTRRLRAARITPAACGRPGISVAFSW